MRGRKQKATAALEGGYVRSPRPPAWLSPEAKDEWKRVVPTLVRRRVISASDMSTVESYCLVVGKIRQSASAINCKSDSATRTMLALMTEARRLAVELGLTPASRQKAAQAPVGEAIDDDDYSDLGI